MLLRKTPKLLSYNMCHNFSTLLNTVREKIWTLEGCTAVCMLLCIMRDRTCLCPIVYLFNSMLTSEFILGTKQKDHTALIQHCFPWRNSNSRFFFLGRQGLPDAWQWPSYKPSDNSDSAKLRNTKFIPTCDCSSGSSASASAGDGSVAVISSSQLSASPSSPRTSCNSA